MLRLFYTAIVAFALHSCGNTQITAVYASYLLKSTQVIVVTAKESNTEGKLVFYERKNVGDLWKIKYQFPVRIGRNGLAFDAAFDKSAEITKKEGDGCSPAGVFSLGPVFSYYAMQNIKMPFEKVTKNHLCVDDKTSAYYNQLILKDSIAKPDWNSFEFMERTDHQYAYGVWVNYNASPIIPGKGSCIFLHVWFDENTPTSGCTAMRQEDLLQLIYALDAEQNPMLIQYVEE